MNSPGSIPQIRPNPPMKSNPYQLEPENREGMGLLVRTCRWKVSEVVGAMAIPH
jgi:hypothetical protein